MLRKPSRIVWLLFAIALLACGSLACWLWVVGRGPAADFEWKYVGDLVRDLQFSPDGRYVAVVSADGRKWVSPQHARIYRVSTGEIVREVDDAAFLCTWSDDGSMFATVTSDQCCIDVFNTANWIRIAHLTYLETKEVGLCRMLYPQRLRFDKHGNLFVVQEPLELFLEEMSSMRGVRVWHDVAKGGLRSETIDVGDGVVAGDVAVASVGEDTRVAIGWAGTNPIRVLTLSGDRHRGQRTDAGYVLRDQVKACLEMTSDGKFLLARDGHGLALFELFRDHAQVLRTWRDEFPEVLSPPTNTLAMSKNGRVAAYSSKRQVTVISIPDCQRLLNLDGFKRPFPIEVSPSGELLAVANESRQRIQFFDIKRQDADRTP